VAGVTVTVYDGVGLTADDPLPEKVTGEVALAVKVTVPLVPT
jgi:hypothetical protein